ncbi:MAG: DUF6270 domain-containing protein [Microbacteriaceae bacterium]
MQKIFIYGSCVTRDSVDWWPEFGFEMDGYVARQSLISSQSPIDYKGVGFDFDSISSNFAKRMALGDVGANLNREIAKHQAEVILWDLCDERGGVLQRPSGSFMTRNVVYSKAELPGRIFQMGTEEHFNLWVKALDEFLRANEGVRIIVNATPWALVTDAGNPVNGDATKAETFNKNIERYYAELETRGLELIRVPQDKTIARVDHKWGEAPFHYVDDTYKEMLVRLKQLLG